MSYSKFPSQAGVYKDDSPLEAKLYWIDADKIRFVRGLPETIYGWERASTSALLGICRGAVTWADNARNPFAAFGTHLRLYAMDVDGSVTDITPVGARGFAASVSFTTQAGVAAVTAAWTGHGMVQDQKFLLENATVTAVGGVTINGTYVVASVVDANTFTFIAAQVASTSAGPTASTVDWTQYLAPGQVDGLGGLGFGTGGFGSGGYGGSSSGYTLYPRSWSLTTWGQNLIANPRGGKLYEWAPNVAASELVTNGSFTGSASGWTLGTGWTYSANTALATLANGDVSQTVTLPPAAWCVLKANVASYTSGRVQPKVNGAAVGGTVSAAGRMAVEFFSGGGGAQTLAMTGLSASLAIDDVSVQVLTTGTALPGAPARVTCAFTTAERILVACGCDDGNGNFDPMFVRWSDQEDNQQWTPDPANLAGDYPLTNGSRIVRGLPGNRENVILTDKALYAMRYVPDPNVVYSFTEIGDGCGLMGPNAIAALGGRFYWMANSGEFYVYDGSYPAALQCTLKRDVADNLAWVQQDKVYAFPVAARNEVWWLYPDGRDGTECSRYVIYNVVDGSWSCGTFARTAWADAGVFQYPLALDTAGTVWFQEKGLTQDGGARSWSLSSAFFDLGDGDSHMRLVGIQPDAGNLQGGYSIQVDARIHNGSGILTRTFGPYGATAATGKISARANGQEARLTFAGSGAPTFWRLGALRLDIEPTGRRR